MYFESDRGSDLGWSLLLRFGKLLSHWRNGCHGVLRKHAPALQLPVLILLQQHRTHQSHDGGVIGKDAHDAGAALDFLVDALEQVGAPQLAPVAGGQR